MKKALSLILVLCMALALTLPAAAEEYEYFETKYAYDYNDGENSWRYEHEYDAQGRMTKYRYIDNGEVQSETEYEYDEAGNLTKIATTRADGTGYSSVYTYNSAGKRIKQVYIGDSLRVTVTYKYNDSGNIESFTYSSDTREDYNFTANYTYETDSAGNITAAVREDTDGYRDSYRYTYDENGNLIKNEREDSEGNTWTYEFEYFADGNLKKETRQRSDNYITYSETEYNERGNVIASKEVCEDGSSETYKYDDDGNVTDKVTVYADGDEFSNHYTYEAGKLISEKQINSGYELDIEYVYENGRIVLERHSSNDYLTYSYELDDNGNVIRLEKTSGAESYVYEYDSAGHTLLEEQTIKQGDYYFHRVEEYAYVAIAKSEIPVAGFEDVHESDYFASAVSWAVSKGVTAGTSKTTFSPKDTVTRAQAVTFLWRAAGKPEPENLKSSFKDVTDENAYYYKAVLWATEKGITQGTGGGKFDLNGTLSYEQMLTFMARAAGTDASGADWSAKAIKWAQDNGMTEGLSFQPTDKCPRHDVVYALWKQMAKNTPSPEIAGY